MAGMTTAARAARRTAPSPISRPTSIRPYPRGSAYAGDGGRRGIPGRAGGVRMAR
jgi:hypothetical protein